MHAFASLVKDIDTIGRQPPPLSLGTHSNSQYLSVFDRLEFLVAAAELLLKLPFLIHQRPHHRTFLHLAAYGVQSALVPDIVHAYTRHAVKSWERGGQYGAGGGGLSSGDTPR